MAGLGLAELIEKVKQDLNSPASANSIPIFSVDEVSIEVQVTVQKEGNAGVTIWVVEAGGKYNKEDVQKITVKLTSLISKEDRLKILKQDYPQYYQDILKQSLGWSLNKGENEENLNNTTV